MIENIVQISDNTKNIKHIFRGVVFFFLPHFLPVVAVVSAERPTGNTGREAALWWASKVRSKNKKRGRCCYTICYESSPRPQKSYFGITLRPKQTNKCVYVLSLHYMYCTATHACLKAHLWKPPITSHRKKFNSHEAMQGRKISLAA